MGVMMGVDVGQVRIGVALSDPAGILAVPWRTLMRDKTHLNDIEILVDTIFQKNITEVYVGLPITLAGGQGSAALDARAYTRKIIAFFHYRQFGVLNKEKRVLRVCLLDERMTTVVAHRVLHANGRKTRQHREVVDQVAAQEILQHDIESKRQRGKNVGIVVNN